MPVAVVKLGSSIVAEENGELRLSVVARISEEVAALHRAGVDVVVVTSGAIARGMQLLGLGSRPAAVQDLQAASAVGQGRLYRTYDELLRERGIQSAQVLLTFFDMSARTHYLNARRDAPEAARVADRAGDQRERHDDHQRDLVRRQRLPGRPGLGARRRRRARAADRHRGALHRRPAHVARRASSSSEVTDPESLEELHIGHAPSPLGSGGMRSKVVAAEMASAAGIPAVIGSGLVAGRDRARAGRASPRARASRRSRCATRASSSGSSTPSRATAS